MNTLINTPLNTLKQFILNCILLILFFLCIDSTAQTIQQQRFEREQKNSDEYYTVISLNEDGLALLRQKNKYEGNKKLWEIVLLDTALQEKKLVEFYLEERFPLVGYEVLPERLYLLYRTGDTNKSNLELLEFNTVNGSEITRYEIKPEVDFKVTHFSKAGSNMVLGGYVSKDPAILLYDLSTKNIKIVPGFLQKDSELVELRVNQNQTFNTVLIDRSLKSERKFVFKTFDETGKLLLDDIVPIEDDRSLQTSISSTLQREDLIVLGTWGERQGKQSSGFFSLSVDPFSEQKIKYFNFGQFNHFVDYLNPKRAERIKENSKDDIQSGKAPSFTAYVIPYRIFENKDGYFLLAEVYNPVSSSSPYYSTPYGNPYYSNPYAYYNPFWPGYYPGMRYRPYAYGNNVKNADQVKTYETVLIAFDAKGDLLWDQSIKIDDIEKPALEQVSDFFYTGTEVIFIYKKKSEIILKTISLKADTAIQTIEKIKLKESSDEIRNEKETEGGLKQWINNTFYVWGYQTIRNQQNKDDRVRDVFYINKMVLH